MSTRRFCADQPTEPFVFAAAQQPKIDELMARYPAERKQSAVIPLLWLAQKQNGGHITRPIIETVATMLGMAVMRVYEVATFYTMFNLAPVGKHFVQVCTTTPCMLAGSDAIVAVCQKRIGAEQGHMRTDGLFSWVEAECLGACANAPMVQINDDYYEDLNAQSFEALLTALEQGQTPQAGSATGRHASEPLSSPSSLADSHAQRTEATNATVACFLKENAHGTDR